MRICIGVILAGGRSRRMGRDKAGLAIGKSNLLHWQIARLSACCDRIIVSGDYPEWDTVPDSIPGLGPLGGVHAAVQHFPDSALWVVPVDMPAFGVCSLQHLRRQQHAAYYQGYPLPAYFPEGEPVCQAITAMLTVCPLDLSIRQLHRRLASQALPVTDVAELTNLNTPTEWAAFQQTLR